MTSINGLGSLDLSKYMNVSYTPVSQNSKATMPETRNDSVTISNPNDGCTDGKDDGKIGFWGALKNTCKGAWNTAKNMVKGCFTNSEGKFSLGKTLLTIGTGALCIAFPAVGLVACGIGAATGAVKMGKGIYKATTAETDAEAKAAWQDVGGGALTTGLSIAGAKASYGAMQTSAAAASESGVSAMESLGENASMAAKGKALVSDMWTSTKGNAVNIKNTVASGIKDVKQAGEIKEASKNVLKAAEKNDEQALAESIAKLEEMKGSEKYQGAFDRIAEKEVQSAESTYTKAVNKTQQTSLSDNVKLAKENFVKAKESGDEALIKDASAELKNAKNELAEFNKGNSKIYQAKNKVNEQFKNATENTRDALEQFTKDSEKGLINRIKAIRKNSSKEAFTNVAKGLSKDGQAILEALTDGTKSYNQLVQEYGYENVLEVLQAFAGFESADKSI